MESDIHGLLGWVGVLALVSVAIFRSYRSLNPGSTMTAAAGHGRMNSYRVNVVPSSPSTRRDSGRPRSAMKGGHNRTHALGDCFISFEPPEGDVSNTVGGNRADQNPDRNPHHCVKSGPHVTALKYFDE